MKAPTAENAQMAADELAQSLVKNLSQSSTVEQPDRGDYFERNGLPLRPRRKYGRASPDLSKRW